MKRWNAALDLLAHEPILDPDMVNMEGLALLIAIAVLAAVTVLVIVRRRRK